MRMDESGMSAHYILVAAITLWTLIASDGCPGFYATYFLQEGGESIYKSSQSCQLSGSIISSQMRTSLDSQPSKDDDDMRGCLSFLGSSFLLNLIANCSSPSTISFGSWISLASVEDSSCKQFQRQELWLCFPSQNQDS